MSVLVFRVEALQVSAARLSNRARIITLYPLRGLVLGLMKQIYGGVQRCLNPVTPQRPGGGDRDAGMPLR